MTVDATANAAWYALTNEDYKAAEAAGYIGDGPELEPETEIELSDDELATLADELAA